MQTFRFCLLSFGLLFLSHFCLSKGGDIDGEAEGDWFGYSVIDGDGCRKNNTSCDSSGFSVDLSADGKTVAIGAPALFSNNSGYVRVYAFDLVNKVWVQKGDDIDGEVGHWVGYSVALSADGSTVAIGAPKFINGNGDKSGHVRVYAFDLVNKVWAQKGGDIDGEAAGDISGRSVRLSADGNTVAIGAPGNNGIKSLGYVRVYAFDLVNKVWAQKGDDIDGEVGHWVGYSVDLSADGNTVAIGAPFNDSNGDKSGHVRVYAFDLVNKVWAQKGGDINGEAEGDYSGTSVDLSADGNTVAIGAPDNKSNGNKSLGHVRVYAFDLVNKVWAQKGGDIDGEIGEGSGHSVGLSADGNTVAIGAPNFDVRVYAFAGSPTASPTASPAASSSASIVSAAVFVAVAAASLI